MACWGPHEDRLLYPSSTKHLLHAPSLTQVQPSELEGILGQLLLPDNAAIQAAQAQLKVIFKRPESVVALVSVLTTSQNEGVRQMAATMLRQRVTKSWMRLPADVKAHVKQTLIASVTSDPSYVGML